MAISSKSKSFSRRSAGALLLVGVLAGVTVGGGVGVIAASTSKSVTVCVDKKDQHMNYSKSGKCKSHQTKLVLNQTGAKGIAGTNGTNGAAGAKGDTGAAGAAGAKGADGAAGTNGTNGTDGAAGTNATVAITQQSVCDGTDVDTVANEVCKIGMTGPGGGPIFFVDYNDQYASFCATGDCNYLEASPASATAGVWCSDTATDLGLTGWDKSAVGAGRTNTATADTTCTSGAVQIAVDYTAPLFNGVAKDDWWLGSMGEMMLMYSNLRQAGIGGFTHEFKYWSSSEVSSSHAWTTLFSTGSPVGENKGITHSVRPVRAF